LVCKVHVVISQETLVSIGVKLLIIQIWIFFYYFVRYEVLMTITAKITVFCGAAPYRFIRLHGVTSLKMVIFVLLVC
jgi:hypothetical protein